MSADSETQTAMRERMSALADGALDDQAVAGTCALWRSDAEARATWHAYQVIGDVLRSDDLAHGAAGDAGFLHALRGRLANEPVVLAPQPLPEPQVMAAVAHAGRSGSRWGWIAPTAVAAGFVAVAGVLLVARTPDSPAMPGAGPTSLSIAASPMVGASALAPVASGDTLAMAVGGQFIRDVQLDRYLAAHKQFAGSSALGVPSGFLRSATIEAPGR